ncbi:nickel insertion protein [Bacillus sp. Marseille-P3661]|uniref:nickel insertion protein n=1 Tax=Bacillus sp. Marseille-P3661 TaxID=1936234 RepID=UPI0035B5025D
MKKKEQNLTEHLDSSMFKVEVNLDDISGEWLGYVLDLLLENGAKDVYYIPIYMKKNRPGVMLQLLCNEQQLPLLKEILFTQTTTLGVRYYPLTVHRLERQFSKVESPWGDITIKTGVHEGAVVQTSPEFDDCKKIADQFNIPIKQVYQYVWSKLEN